MHHEVVEIKDSDIEEGIKELIKELIDINVVPIVDIKRRKIIRPEFTPEYNSSRILIMIKNAGVNGCINSKVKFIFYDFLLRYPICLKYILGKNGIDEYFSNAELLSIDKKMVKHVSSAWDPDYYNYLSFLQSRNLINFRYESNFKIELTELGKEIVEELEIQETEIWSRRCKYLKKLFNSKTDEEIKNIIKENFSFTVI